MDLSKELWIGDVTDVRTQEKAIESLAVTNDAKYWDDEDGITKVDEERWKTAQKFEFNCWMTHARHTADDRSLEHKNGFNNYNDLPNDLGDVIEIGCGPFTQFKFITANTITAKSISLLDPLLNSYTSHPHCSYNDNQINGVKIKNKYAAKSEELTANCEYDTLICINVLEHVLNAQSVFDNMYNALKADGLIIFHERSWDHIDINKLYDAGHPIRLKLTFIERFISRFSRIYYNNEYFIGKKI